MSNVLDQAQNVQGVVAAARKRDAWSRQEANATDDGKRRLYREAIFDLEQRFPDLAEVPVGGAEAFARERGHGRGSRSPVHDGRRRTRSGAPAKKPTSAKPKAAAKPRPSTPRRTRRRGRPTTTTRPSTSAPTPRVDRAIRRTGIPATVDAGGGVVLAAAGATVGLGLAYLVLSSAEQKGSGAAAVPTVIDGVVHGVGRFIGLGDVFSDNNGTPPPEKGSSVEPTYDESPGSDVATAGARLKAAANGRSRTRHPRRHAPTHNHR